MDNPLPPGWEIHRDAEGNTYFYHRPTDVSQWHEPQSSPPATYKQIGGYHADPFQRHEQTQSTTENPQALTSSDAWDAYRQGSKSPQQVHTSSNIADHFKARDARWLLLKMKSDGGKVTVMSREWLGIDTGDTFMKIQSNYGAAANWFVMSRARDHIYALAGNTVDDTAGVRVIAPPGHISSQEVTVLTVQGKRLRKEPFPVLAPGGLRCWAGPMSGENDADIEVVNADSSGARGGHFVVRESAARSGGSYPRTYATIMHKSPQNAGTRKATMWVWVNESVDTALVLAITLAMIK